MLKLGALCFKPLLEAAGLPPEPRSYGIIMAITFVLLRGMMIPEVIMPTRLETLMWKHAPSLWRAGELVADMYRARAETGDVEAQHELGEWYQWAPTEQGRHKSWTYYRWYKQAANNGDRAAQSRLDGFLGWPSANHRRSLTPDERAKGLVYPDLMNAAFIELGKACGIDIPLDVQLLDASSDAQFEAVVRARDAQWEAAQDRTTEAEVETTDQAPVAEDPFPVPVVAFKPFGNFAVSRSEFEAADRERQAKLIQEAEQRGHEAVLEVADGLLSGLRNKRDEWAAFRLYRGVAESGHPVANTVLGHLYQYGIGTERDYVAARRCYEQAVQAGYEWAYLGLGSLYEAGMGVQPDPKLALECYLKGAVVAPSHHGQFHRDGWDEYLMLANLYEHGPDSVRDPELAFQAYLGEFGNGGPNFKVGFLYHYGLGVQQAPVNAMERYIRGAGLYDYGYPARCERECDYRLGLLYWEGLGVDLDAKAALGLFEVADMPQPLFLAASAFKQGDRVPADLEKSLALFRRASQVQVAEDSAYLQFLLSAQLDDSGLAHLQRALAHLEQAARQGWAPAQFDLAWLLLNGPAGIESNPGEAHRWLQAAASQGYVGALAQQALLLDTALTPAWEAFTIAAEASRQAIALGPTVGRSGPGHFRLPIFEGLPEAAADALNEIRRVADSLDPGLYERQEWLETLTWRETWRPSIRAQMPGLINRGD